MTTSTELVKCPRCTEACWLCAGRPIPVELLVEFKLLGDPFPTHTALNEMRQRHDLEDSVTSLRARSTW